MYHLYQFLIPDSHTLLSFLKNLFSGPRMLSIDQKNVEKANDSKIYSTTGAAKDAAEKAATDVGQDALMEALAESQKQIQDLQEKVSQQRIRNDILEQNHCQVETNLFEICKVMSCERYGPVSVKAYDVDIILWEQVTKSINLGSFHNKEKWMTLKNLVQNAPIDRNIHCYLPPPTYKKENSHKVKPQDVRPEVNSKSKHMEEDIETISNTSDLSQSDDQASLQVNIDPTHKMQLEILQKSLLRQMNYFVKKGEDIEVVPIEDTYNIGNIDSTHNLRDYGVCKKSLSLRIVRRGGSVVLRDEGEWANIPVLVEIPFYNGNFRYFDLKQTFVFLLDPIRMMLKEDGTVWVCAIAEPRPPLFERKSMYWFSEEALNYLLENSNENSRNGRKGKLKEERQTLWDEFRNKFNLHGIKWEDLYKNTEAKKNFIRWIRKIV